MKLDTETLIKQRFWVVAAVCPLLVFIAWLIAVTGVAGAITDQKKMIEGKIKDIKDAGRDAKRPDEVKIRKKEADLHKALEDIVWKEAFEAQENTRWFNLTPRALASLAEAGVPETALSKLSVLQNMEFGESEQFVAALATRLAPQELAGCQELVLK